MYARIRDSRLELSRDARAVSYSIPADAFQEIAYTCSCPDPDAVLITAVLPGGRLDDVSQSARGDYRAYRVTPGGIEPLTREYTSSAIALPDGGIAYYNGGALVAERATGREVHKLGRFTWGPASISCSADGSRIAMTRWKSDDRKLAWTTSGAPLQISRFSYFSYLLLDDCVRYEKFNDVFEFDFTLQKSRTLTTLRIKQKFLDEVGIAAGVDELHVKFSNLSRLDGAVIASLLVFGKRGAIEGYHGIVRFDPETNDITALHTLHEPWRVSSLQSNGDTLRAVLERYEETRVVERRSLALGRDAHFLEEGWGMLGHPRYPGFGFQFLPRATD